VAAHQLFALGYTRHQIRSRRDVGRLHPVYKGVYAVGYKKLSPEGYQMAAVLACGPHAVLSHKSAAALHGLLRTDQVKVDVTVPGTSRNSRPRIRVHRTRVLHEEDIATIDGIPVTSLARTLLDIASVLRPQPLLYAIEEAVRQEVFDLKAVNRAIERTPMRAGVARLQTALGGYKPPPRTRSKSERRLFDALCRAGLPPPLVNAPFAGYELDFYWPQFRLVVELDSPHYHSSPREFETDRRKDAVLQRAGLAVLRVTEERVEHDLPSVIDDVIALARRRSAA
jgi:very-short-patch-repair endonuclease